MTVDPKVKTACATCGKQRPQAKRNDTKANSGTRLPVDVWVISLQRDPFCSTECCRSHYGVLPPIDTTRGSCPDCGKVHSMSRPRTSGNRCKNCAEKYRKRRRCNIPGACAGCGGAFTESTLGCAHCSDRRRRRERRANEPGYLERENARERAYRARRRAEKKAKLAAASRLVEPASPAGSHSGGNSLKEAA